MKHIKYELDFIPVDERMPDVGEVVYALFGHELAPYSFPILVTRETRGWVDWLPGPDGHVTMYPKATHWAKVHTIWS